MRALTLYPEHAELFRLGIRTIETRGWAAPPDAIGERIAIHAGKRDPDSAAARRDPITRRAMAAIPHGDPLTRGAVVLTARLADCVPIHEYLCNCPTRASVYAMVSPAHFGSGHGIVGLFEAPSGRAYDHPTWGPSKLDCLDPAHPRQQAPFGDFRCGRWAWLVDQTEPLPEPIEARGKQGLWTWEPSA